MPSEKRGRAIIKPIGSPLAEKPQGTEIAGSPRMSKGEQLEIVSGSRGVTTSSRLRASLMVRGDFFAGMDPSRRSAQSERRQLVLRWGIRRHSQRGRQQRLQRRCGHHDKLTTIQFPRCTLLTQFFRKLRRSASEIERKANLPLTSNMGIKRLLAYGAIYLLWGGAYLAVRVLVGVIPSSLAAGARYCLAALCLSPFLFVLSSPAPNWRQSINAVWTGTLMLTIGYGVVFWAEKRLPSWMVAVLVSTTFLWTYLGECLVLRSYKFRAAMLLPLLIGLAGMPLVMEGSSSWSEVSMIRALAVLFGALCWSAGSLFVKRIDMPRSTIYTVELQLASSGILLLCLSAALGEWTERSAMEWIFAWRPLLAMAYLVVGASLLGFASFHWLLKHEPASLVATSSYVNPIVATALGILAAHERFSLLQLVGAMAVVGSIVAFWRLQAPADGLGILAMEPSPKP